MKNCQNCSHYRVCEIYRTIVTCADEPIKKSSKSAGDYALTVSAFRKAIAEGCKYYAEVTPAGHLKKTKDTSIPDYPAIGYVWHTA